MNNPLAAAVVQQLITQNVLAAHLVEQQQRQQNLLPAQQLIGQPIQLQQVQQGLNQNQIPHLAQINHAQQQVVQQLNNIRNQQIEESYSYLNSDSFHCPPTHYLQPPAGALSQHFYSQGPTSDNLQIPTTYSTQQVRRKSTQATLESDHRRSYARSNSPLSTNETNQQIADLRRILATAQTLCQDPSSASASCTVGSIAHGSTTSRTPSPASSIGSAGSAPLLMSNNNYTTSNNNSYVTSNNNSYVTSNNNSYATSNNNRGMKRHYDDDYYEKWDDPSGPAKRSRGDEVNQPKIAPSGQRSNLAPVKVSNSTRDCNQNNRDVKKAVEDVPVPPPNVTPNQDQKVTNHIWQHFLDKQQSQTAYQKKMRLREALYTVTKGIFPYCGLYMVGSSMSGFGSIYSDLDMCLMLSHKAMDQKREATDILALLLKSLKKCSFIKQMELIRARVPILKFRDKIANVECDLNVNNHVGIRNTHLLGAYSRMDWRVRPLVLFTKHWAQFHDINDAKKMTISSYSLTMMVIHYLQCCEPPVLPALHKLEPDKYNSERDVRTLSLAELLPEFQTKNTETLAELFLGFLNYYAHKFEFENNVISIRLGVKLPKSVVLRQSFAGPAAQWKYLCIEEPFDLSNTSRSVYDEYTFMRILQVFRMSHRRLATTRNAHSLFDHPF